VFLKPFARASVEGRAYFRSGTVEVYAEGRAAWDVEEVARAVVRGEVAVGVFTFDFSPWEGDAVRESFSWLEGGTLRLAKFFMEDKEADHKASVLVLLGKLIGGGDDERLGRGICPKPGRLTLPSPST